MKHEGYNGLEGNPSYKYKYNGKEMQETGMYDYGWRQYMPDVARWMQLDPLVEDTEDPYAYVFNNPISLTDPDGRAPDGVLETDCCPDSSLPSDDMEFENTAFDLTTIGLSAVGGPEGVLMSQGVKPAYLKAFESVKNFQKTRQEQQD